MPRLRTYDFPGSRPVYDFPGSRPVVIRNESTGCWLSNNVLFASFSPMFHQARIFEDEFSAKSYLELLKQSGQDIEFLVLLAVCHITFSEVSKEPEPFNIPFGY